VRLRTEQERQTVHHAKTMRRRQTGFSLVETAIIVVIIGLLLGGILKGQELITQAKTRNVIADFTGISAAYYGYRDRYRAIPGDDARAASRWAGATSGNGDGVLSGKYNSNAATDESRLWWEDLRRAGFVAGAGSLQPFNAVAGMLGVQTGDAAGSTSLSGLGGLMVCTAGLPAKIAIAVDAQMDDGKIGSGAVRGQYQSGGPNADISATAATGYSEAGNNVYILCRAL
jgi:type II secretory pathway pseudopilin PulG